MIKGRMVISDSVPKWVVEKGSSFAKTSVTSWSEFHALIEVNFLDWSEYIFRGQRKAQWSLRSRFDREYLRALERIEKIYLCKEPGEKELALNRLGTREWLLERQLERFKRASLGRRGLAPRELSLDEWWSLGRHFGLATPLLDWTRSPYVACFFAIQDPQASKSNFRAVWAFSQPALRNIQVDQQYDRDSNGRRRSVIEVLAEEASSDGTEPPSVQLLEPLVDENSRMLSQSGLFTRTPKGEDIEKFIKQNVDLSGSGSVLYRIDISEDQRETFLRQLEAMNIHSGSLFPDLSGATDYCNRALEKQFFEDQWRESDGFRYRLMSNRPTHE